MAGRVETFAGGLDPGQAHRVVAERMEQAHGVGAAADTGDDLVGQAVEAREQLLARLGPDHLLEVAHHGRVGRRSGHRTDDVEGVAYVGHPVAQRLVHGVLERTRAALDGGHGRPEQTHAYHVQLLAADVFDTHVHLAIETQQGAGGGGGDTVLAGAGLGDHAAPAHARREERSGRARC